MLYVILGIGLLLIIDGIAMNTKNIVSALIFKVFPFFSGMFLVYYSLKELEVL